MSHNIKSDTLTILKCTSSGFSTFAMLRNRIFTAPKGNPHTRFATAHLVPSPRLWPFGKVLSVTVDVPVPDISGKWDPRPYAFCSWLLSLGVMFSRVPRAAEVSAFRSFLCPLGEYSTVPLAIDQRGRGCLQVGLRPPSAAHRERCLREHSYYTSLCLNTRFPFFWVSAQEWNCQAVWSFYV